MLWAKNDLYFFKRFLLFRHFFTVVALRALQTDSILVPFLYEHAVTLRAWLAGWFIP